MKAIFDDVSEKCSVLTTKSYSTSFSMGILLLAESMRKPIYAIYGFVRFADEIVDTFHEYDKAALLGKFRMETFEAIEKGISMNPILNSFQWAVNTYRIDLGLVGTFLNSMEMDLDQTSHDDGSLSTYILGSAEVVGLMCLKVFCRGEDLLYEKLKGPAMKLGAAFQKVNFLRDLKYDHEALGRTYFPGIDFRHFSTVQKKQIEKEIEDDFSEALIGIKELPKPARLGVYVAYVYYIQLFRKIRKFPPEKVKTERIRVHNFEKLRLLCSSYFYHNLDLL